MVKIRFNPRMMLYLIAFLAFSLMAHAHILSGNGFPDGVLHPLSGIDHLLAMIAVGIVSVQFGGKWAWKMPLTFVTCMIAGAVFGIVGIKFPYIEFAIALSVIFSGLAIIFHRKISASLVVAFIGLSAIFHGHAHGSEMSVIANPALYSAGFIFSTAILHASGIVIGNYAAKTTFRRKLLRISGAAIGVAGFMLLFGF